MATRIRHATPQDFDQIREICCLTGHAGEPIDRARWPFFAEYWVGPYQAFWPDWTWVAESIQEPGKVVGYINGAPSTIKHRARLFWFYLKLVFRCLLGEFPRNNDVKRFIKRFFKLERGPESSFAHALLQGIRHECPAHLHINLVESARGSGVGHQLIAEFETALKTRGVHGIHLFCGEGPLKFYERAGFFEAARTQFRAGIFVYLLTKRLHH